jgi:hypothetical protein
MRYSYIARTVLKISVVKEPEVRQTKEEKMKETSLEFFERKRRRLSN